jgi:hypothetical protein
MFNNLWERVKAAGIPFDSHATDLYIPVTEETRKLIADYEHKSIVTTFVSNIDKKLWFDIPFAYIPAWEAKSRNVHASNP